MNLRSIERGFAAGMIIASLNGCGSSKESLLVTKGEKDFQIENAPGRAVEAVLSPDFNKSYLSSLLTNLQREVGTRETRLSAIQDNMSILLGNEGNNGTALRIDENGTFLTVGHNLTRGAQGRQIVATPIDAVHLKSGGVAPTRRAFVNLQMDMALVSAASGKATKAVEGITISARDLTIGEQVWFIGVVQDPKTERFNMRVAAGSIVQKPSDIPEPLQGLVYARDIDPIGGMSGGVVVDKDGKIVGLIQGKAEETVNGKVVSKVARIVPLKNYQTSLEQAAQISLP